MLSGGSVASWSVTFAAKTVTVHVSEPTKSASGSSVNVVGPPLAAAVWPPLEEQEIENQLPVTFTGSLKVIVTLLSSATLAPPFAGCGGGRRGAEGWGCRRRRGLPGGGGGRRRRSCR